MSNSILPNELVEEFSEMCLHRRARFLAKQPQVVNYSTEGFLKMYRLAREFCDFCKLDCEEYAKRNDYYLC